MEDLRELLERIQASVAIVIEVQMGNLYGISSGTNGEGELVGEPHSEKVQVTFCGQVGLGKDLAEILLLDPDMLKYRLQRDPEKCGAEI